MTEAVEAAEMASRLVDAIVREGGAEIHRCGVIFGPRAGLICVS